MVLFFGACSNQSVPTISPPSINNPSPTITKVEPSFTPSKIVTSTPELIPSPDFESTLLAKFPPPSQEIHINPDGTGDFLDIFSAVESAPPGAVIYLSAGKYELSKMLLVDKPIQLIGAGMDSTEIFFDGSVSGFFAVAFPSLIYFQGEGPFFIQGITFQNYSSQPTDIVHASGYIFVDNCRFKGGRELIDDNGIYLIDGSGLFFEDGFVKNSETIENEGRGYQIVSNDHAILMNNNCSWNKVGIEFWSGNGLVESNLCENNEIAGISLVEDSNVEFITNTLAQNGGFGISFSGTSIGSLKKNIIRNNKCGIYSSESASPSIQNNEINQNEFGIVFAGTSYGTFEYNTCDFNKVCISIVDYANPTIKGNIISNNSSHGIYYSDESFGNATENKCQNNEINIEIIGNAHPTLDNPDCP